MGRTKSSTLKSVEITDTTAPTQTVTLFADEGNTVAVVSSVDFILLQQILMPTFTDYFGTNDVKAGITLANGMKFSGTATSC